MNVITAQYLERLQLFQREVVYEHYSDKSIMIGNTLLRE